MNRWFWLPGFALGFALGVALQAQQAPVSDTSRERVLKSQTEEVIVDLVVRDHKGHLVSDLSKSELTVFDNNVPKPIRLFRLVQAPGVEPAAVKQTSNARHEMRLVTLIFDQADLNSRRMARDAALELLKQELPPNIYMAVFRLNHGLQAVESFTHDREALRKAIDRATGEPVGSARASNEQFKHDMDRLLGPDPGGMTLEERVDRETDHFAKILLQTMLVAVRTDERNNLTESGRNVLLPLWAAVHAESELPGRKFVLFFSPGFSVPFEMDDNFKALIDAANRTNMTFFSIDPRGLETVSANRVANDQLSSAGRASMTHGQSHDTIATDIMITDQAANSGRFNTQDMLAVLAESTGGTLIANTNDIRMPVQKMLEEIETYYELSYLPGVRNYDGSFHKITVKSSRPNVRIQAKSGYLAIPPSLAVSDQPLSVSDIALTQSLESAQAAQTFPFESGAYFFRGGDREQICEVVLDLPLRVVTMEKSSANDMFEGGLKYLIRIKNGAGEVVKTMHGELPLSLRPDQLDSVKRSEFTNTEEIDLPPGRYSVDVAMLDRKSGKTSVRKSVIVLPEKQEKLSMSSVALIRSWKPKEAEAPADDPFVFEGKTMTPTLTPVVHKADSTSLPFYLVVYPNLKKEAKPELIVEFDREGKQQRVRVPMVGAPDQFGRIQYVANAPIAQFEPGNYAVRFIVKQGDEMVQESVGLLLER